MRRKEHKGMDSMYDRALCTDVCLVQEGRNIRGWASTIRSTLLVASWSSLVEVVTHESLFLSLSRFLVRLIASLKGKLLELHSFAGKVMLKILTRSLISVSNTEPTLLMRSCAYYPKLGFGAFAFSQCF